MKKYGLKILLVSLLVLSGCVFEHTTLSSYNTLPDGTEVTTDSRIVNFSFSEFAQDYIGKVIDLLSKLKGM